MVPDNQNQEEGMAYPWSRRFCGVLTVLLIAGCGPMLIESDPAIFRVPSKAAEQLRGQQSIVLKNAHEKETLALVLSKEEAWIGAGKPTGWQADLRQYTETAIILLGGEMTGKGIDLSPQAAKSVTLRVHDLRVNVIPYPIVPKYESSLVLEAQYADGTKSVIATDNNSPGDISRAFSGAIMRAVTRLLRDENFLAYVNR